MVFKKMLRAMGVGGPSVETVLANANYAADIFVGGHKHTTDLIHEDWDERGMTIKVPQQPGLGVTLREEYAA